MKLFFNPSFILLIFICSELRGQQPNFSCNEFTITQYQWPNYREFDNYLYKNGRLSVYKKRKKIYHQKLSKGQIETLDSILNYIDINNLDSVYYRRMLDGTSWNFEFSNKSTTKKVSLGNYYLPKLDSLLNYLNKQIPTRKQTISFRHGHFTNLDSKSDTSFIIFPDFTANEVIITDTSYDSYEIICFNKRNIFSIDNDSIVRWECILYNYGLGNKRKYWDCTRINDYQWKKTIYDSQNIAIGYSIIEEIRPLEFHELGYQRKTIIPQHYPGDKPSVFILKFYKTIEKNNP